MCKNKNWRERERKMKEGKREKEEKMVNKRRHRENCPAAHNWGSGFSSFFSFSSFFFSRLSFFPSNNSTRCHRKQVPAFFSFLKKVFSPLSFFFSNFLLFLFLFPSFSLLIFVSLILFSSRRFDEKERCQHMISCLWKSSSSLSSSFLSSSFRFQVESLSRKWDDHLRHDDYGHGDNESASETKKGKDEIEKERSQRERKKVVVLKKNPEVIHI